MEMVGAIMNDDEVVIIGAGIGGLATALALHIKGIKSVVMERSETLRNTTGAAIGIRQNGWRALNQLGVADILRRKAIPIQRERTISVGKPQQSRPIDGEARCLRRKDLINALYDALPPATVKFGCKLESIKLDPNDSKPVLRFIDGTSIIAKVVIGCDGSHSVVADFLNLKPTKTFSFCGVRGLTNFPDGHNFGPEVARIIKGNVPVGRASIDDNTVYWFVGQHSAPRERIWEDPEVARKSALETLQRHEYPQEVQEMVKNADTNSLSFTHLRYRAPWDLVTGTFCKGTVTVVGDAMHVMGPFLGQGGSAALEDAVVLARNLAQTGLNRVESKGNLAVCGVEEALNLYVKQRRMRLLRLSLQSYLSGMLVDASSLLKKLMYIGLLLLLFRNSSGHINYDCGDL